MDDITQLDDCYNKYIKNVSNWIPEGITTVNLKLLQRFDLLDYHRKEKKEPALTRYFHVVETAEKITLINEQFVVWIVPDKVDNLPITYALIALNHSDQPQLEMAFSASGVFNTSRLVLRVLDVFLQEIQETEDVLSKYKTAS